MMQLLSELSEQPMDKASIFVANTLNSKYMGAIMVAAYSYMALVPIIQPVAIKAVTTKKNAKSV